MTAATTLREMADACCDECRALTGEGPWCCRCGAERPGNVAIDGYFTEDICSRCEIEMAEDLVIRAAIEWHKHRRGTAALLHDAVAALTPFYGVSAEQARAPRGFT